jgi:hypothetical protein
VSATVTLLTAVAEIFENLLPEAVASQSRANPVVSIPPHGWAVQVITVVATPAV